MILTNKFYFKNFLQTDNKKILKKNRNFININKPFDKRSTLSKRPSTFDRNESKSNGAANPWSTLRDLLLKKGKDETLRLNHKHNYALFIQRRKIEREREIGRNIKYSYCI